MYSKYGRYSVQHFHRLSNAFVINRYYVILFSRDVANKEWAYQVKLFKGINLLFGEFITNNYLCNILSKRWFRLSSTCILILCQGCFSSSIIYDVGEVRQSIERSSLSIIETEEIGNYSLKYIVQRKFYWHDNNLISQRWFSKASPMSPVSLEKNVDLWAMQSFAGTAKHKIINLKPTGNIPVAEAWDSRYNIEDDKMYIVFHQRSSLAGPSILYQTQDIMLYDLKYTPWYGYLLKASLFPFAIVADISTSPLQLIMYLTTREIKKGW
jgi:hypothetical protein